MTLRPGAAVKRTLGGSWLRPVFAAFAAERRAGCIAGAEAVAGGAVADLERKRLAIGQGKSPEAGGSFGGTLQGVNEARWPYPLGAPPLNPRDILSPMISQSREDEPATITQREQAPHQVSILLPDDDVGQQHHRPLPIQQKPKSKYREPKQVEPRLVPLPSQKHRLLKQSHEINYQENH